MSNENIADLSRMSAEEVYGFQPTEADQAAAFEIEHPEGVLKNALFAAVENAVEAGVSVETINLMLLDLAGENAVVEAALKLQPKGGRR